MNQSKGLVCVAAVCGCLLGATCASAAPGDLVLVRDGEPAATIVVAREAMEEPAPTSSIAEKYPRVVWKRLDAAKELQSYVRKITGAELPITADDEEIDGRTILVGASRYTRDLGLRNQDFVKQEYLIRSRGDRLILMGRDETFDHWAGNTTNVDRAYSGCFSPLSTYQSIGTSYAVTSFLEDYCGVRWYFIGELGEVVPRRATLVVPSINVRRQTSTRHRTVRPDLMPPNFYIEPRLAENAPGSRFPAYDVADQPHNADACAWGRRLKLGGDVFVANHSLYGYYGRFAKDHPNWFANGKPVRGHMMCFASEGLLKQVVSDARAYFDGERGGTAVGPFFAVVPMDNETWCQCDRCRSQYMEMDWPAEGKGHKRIDRSNYVWGFVAKVAREVQKTHPDKFISCVAYRSYFWAPDPEKVQLPSNVAVQICPGFDALTSPSPYPPYGTAADAHKAWFADWAKVVNPDHVYMWWYWLWPINPDHLSFPNVSPYVVGDFVRGLKRYGFGGGAFCQIDEKHGHWWSYPVLDHLRVYVAAKLFDNWDLDERQIVEEYYRLFYGPAEQPMKQFWDYIHQTPYKRHPAVTHPDRFAKWRTSQVPKPKDWDWTMICPPEDIKQLGAWLDEARTLVPTTSIYRHRIDLIDKAVYQAYLVRASREARGESTDTQSP